MTYDYMNRLVSAKNQTYTYNAENMRIRNECGMYDTKYTYDPSGKLNKLIMKNTNDSVKKYVYGIGLIGEDDNGHFKTYHFDYRGSTVAITNESGAITDRFAYDTYGKQISHTGNSFIIFGYNGRDGIITDVNGLLYMRSRYYSPELKRFVNADVLHGNISDSSSLNRYSYVNGNPVSYVDPFGFEGEDSWWSKTANWISDKLAPVKTWVEENKGWAALIGFVAGPAIASHIVTNTIPNAIGLAATAFAGATTFASSLFAGATSIAGIAVATLPQSILVGGVSGALLGGIGNAIFGKSFWDGCLAGGMLGTSHFLYFQLEKSLLPISPLLSLGVHLASYNNSVDFIYYTFFADGESSIIESDLSADPSYYVNNGNPSRTEILNYIKSYMANNSDGHSENWFTPKAWFYYNEYKFHMYAWNLLGWAHVENSNGGPLSQLAERARHTTFGENHWSVDLLIAFMGLLGI